MLVVTGMVCVGHSSLSIPLIYLFEFIALLTHRHYIIIIINIAYK